MKNFLHNYVGDFLLETVKAILVALTTKVIVDHMGKKKKRTKCSKKRKASSSSTRK